MSGPDDPLEGIWLSAGDLADLFHVSGKTISRWSRDGRLPVSSRTLQGGHRRYSARSVVALLAKVEPDKPHMSDEEFAIWYVRRHPTKRPRS